MAKEGTELLNIAGVAARVGVLDAALSSGTAMAATLLAQARAVLEALRTAPGEPLEAAEPVPKMPDSPYSASRWSDGAVCLQVRCWREEAFRLEGDFKLGVLERVSLQGGERALGLFGGEDGETVYDTAAESFALPGPEEQSRERAREERIQAARKELWEAFCAMGGWACPACTFFNEEGAAACERCQAPAPVEVVRSQSALAAARASAPDARPGGESSQGILKMLAGLRSGASVAAAAAAGAATLILRRPPKRCGSCGKEIEEGTRFCKACGAGIPLRCPSCGAECPPDHKFCGACGTRLNAGEEKKP